MRVALGCVLLLPAALHLLLCPARASSTSPAARRTLQPLYHAQHARHDPLLDLGLLTGFSRHLSLTPQDTPLTPQPLDDLSLMERPPVHVFSSLTDDLRRSYLRDVSDFPIGDFDILQWLLEDPETSTGVTKKGRNICRGSVVSGNVWCPSTLLQMISGLPSFPAKPQPAHRSPESLLPTQHSTWFKASPAKRYLGIELPDYIATSYSSIKTDNAHYLTKLHQLKQRMRSAGK
ncbi:uncharacterized protein LOC123498649 [Portunus trituberculatus]|uniref:uncharacterized protein LOC123498649 n=1 Tax=Portunus trituberculatus TaxID=210409 RepID=UPI001E1D1219|nr:uncharacterized protein LOC123498649 [Portunus trituberculatus]